MAKNYYAILGVNKTASKDEIKQAFRKLAHQHHPDKKGGDEARFKEISEAYGVLSSDKRRAEYDSYGRVFSGAGGAGSGGFGGFDFSQGGNFSHDFQNFDLGDIFSEFFGGGRTGRKVRRGSDISIDIELSFKEAIFGTSRKVVLTKTSTCKTCNGSGAKQKTDLMVCKTCNGKGALYESKRSVLGTFTSTRICDVCSGRGQVPKENCIHCKGAGVERRQEEITINIPANVNNGEMVRLSGFGEAIAGGSPGDLYVKLHIINDNNFKREGSNIVTGLNIKLSDALLGGTYAVKTLGDPVTISVPQGASPGDTIRIKDMGVPVTGGRRGDLIVELTIEIPKKLSRKAKKLVEDLKQEGV